MGLRPLVGIRFQVLFHSPNRGPFQLSLALLFTIGHQVVLSLARWAALIHARFHGTGATREIHWRPSPFVYGTVTLFGLAFQPVRLDVGFVTPCYLRSDNCGSHNPLRATPASYYTRKVWAISLFARRYWGSRCLFPFLQVLRWVSSLRYPPYTMDSCMAHEGLPRVVSESGGPPDQCPLAASRSLSQLNHALRRLLVPSHPHVHPF